MPQTTILARPLIHAANVPIRQVLRVIVYLKEKGVEGGVAEDGETEIVGEGKEGDEFVCGPDFLADGWVVQMAAVEEFQERFEEARVVVDEEEDFSIGDAGGIVSVAAANVEDLRGR